MSSQQPSELQACVLTFGSDEVDGGVSLEIRLGSYKVDLMLGNDGKMDVRNIHSEGLKFLSSFFMNRNNERPINEDSSDHIVFYKWLLKNTVIKTIGVVGGWKENFAMLLREMKEIMCKSGKIVLVNTPVDEDVTVDDDVDPWIYDMDLINEAQHVTSMLQLVFNGHEIWHSRHLGIWNQFNDNFPEVVIEVDHTWVRPMLCNIHEAWKTMAMNSFKFTFKFNYNIPADIPVNSLAHGKVIKFDNVSPTDQVALFEFNNFEDLPKVLVCTDQSTGSVLIFKIRKEDEFAIVTATVV